MAGAPITQLSMQHRVRGIETDASGSMPASWVARLCESARWEIFSVEDLVLRAAMQGGVVRASVFEYLEPMRHGDQIEISTWIARVGRTSLDFGHALHRVADDRVTARARVTIVHLGPSGPAPLDPELQRSVTERPAPIAKPWPEGERSCAWAHDWIVRPSDQDSFRHVNQARYIDYVDDARQLAALAAAPAGCEGFLRSLQLEYIRETHAAQRVQMQTWVTEPDRRAFELSRLGSGELLCRGQVQCAPPTRSS